MKKKNDENSKADKIQDMKNKKAGGKEGDAKDRKADAMRQKAKDKKKKDGKKSKK